MRFAAAFFLIVSAVLTAAQSAVTLNTPYVFLLLVPLLMLTRHRRQSRCSRMLQYPPHLVWRHRSLPNPNSPRFVTIPHHSPFLILVISGGQPSAAPLEDLGILTGTSYTWLCKQAAGERISPAISGRRQASEGAVYRPVCSSNARAAAHRNRTPFSNRTNRSETGTQIFLRLKDTSSGQLSETGTSSSIHKILS